MQAPELFSWCMYFSIFRYLAYRLNDNTVDWFIILQTIAKLDWKDTGGALDPSRKEKLVIANL